MVLHPAKALFKPEVDVVPGTRNKIDLPVDDVNKMTLQGYDKYLESHL